MVLGLNIVMSASAPTCNLPFRVIEGAIFSKRLAGMIVIFFNAVIRSSTFSSRTYLPSILENVPAVLGCAPGA